MRYIWAKYETRYLTTLYLEAPKLDVSNKKSTCDLVAMYDGKLGLLMLKF